MAPVVPVILPNGPKLETLPPFLRAYSGVNMSEGLSQDVVDKLCWGITGKKDFGHP